MAGAGATAAVISALAWLWPDPLSEANDPAIYGRWESKYEYPATNGIVELNGVTEFFENETFRYSGTLTRTSTQPQGVAVYSINGAGEWKGNDERIITKLTSAKSSLKDVQPTWMRAMVTSTPSEEIPTGSSELYKVLSLNEDKIEVEVANLQGTPIKFAMIKTKKRMP